MASPHSWKTLSKFSLENVFRGNAADGTAHTMCAKPHIESFSAPHVAEPTRSSASCASEQECFPWKAAGVWESPRKRGAEGSGHLSAHYPENPMVPLWPPSCQRKWSGPCKCTWHPW